MSIQPALTNASIEYWKEDNVRYQLSSGLVSKMDTLPNQLLDSLEKELMLDTSAQRGLDKLGVLNHEDRLIKFFDCNYSAFDKNPDMDQFGILGLREFIECSKRGACIAEGECCKFPNNLSKKESLVAKMIALGYTDAQICYELDIAQDTLRNHKNSIERKIGKKGKPAIAAWAVTNNFI